MATADLEAGPFLHRFFFNDFHPEADPSATQPFEGTTGSSTGHREYGARKPAARTFVYAPPSQLSGITTD